jgi:hypothetical protein
MRRGNRHAAAGHSASRIDGLAGISTSTKRASNCSERLRTKTGQCAAPGMISFSAAIIWQPLHEPSANVSVRAKKRSNSARARAL